MARGPKKHMKRLRAPKHWMLDKLTGVFAPRPSTGPYRPAGPPSTGGCGRLGRSGQCSELGRGWRTLGVPDEIRVWLAV